MNSKTYNVIALMSGTSLDGVDICYLSLVRGRKWSFQIRLAKTISYSKKWKRLLLNAVDSPDLTKLNQIYTSYLGEIINSFIKENEITNILAICSHGHTVFHEPKKGITLQIGNLPDIAKITGIRTICDFRVQDVFLGGQGAPLVPIGDHLLFSEYDYCVNLGGFANLSFEQNNTRTAFDICPLNVVLNHYAGLQGQDFDASGSFAKAGTINVDVLNQLNDLSYYKANAPKSLGVEWVADHIFPILSVITSPIDALATFTEHVAIQIANVLTGSGTALITGGGAFNEYLIQRIESLTSSQLSIPDSQTVEYKEAVIFGLLGVLRLRNENNCMASVTGAVRDHSSGEIYLP